MVEADYLFKYFPFSNTNTNSFSTLSFYFSNGTIITPPTTSSNFNIVKFVPKIRLSQAAFETDNSCYQWSTNVRTLV
jgi:hypothetical protein